MTNQALLPALFQQSGLDERHPRLAMVGFDDDCGSVHRGPAFIVVRNEGGVQGRESDPPPASVGVFREGPPGSPVPVCYAPLWGTCVWLGTGLPDVAPRRGPSQELALRSVEGLPGMEEIEEREAGRAAATDPASPVAFGVVARVALALCLYPLGDLQLVRELESSYILARDARSGRKLRDPSCGKDAALQGRS